MGKFENGCAKAKPEDRHEAELRAAAEAAWAAAWERYSEWLLEELRAAPVNQEVMA